jgi:hypothetical protein
MDLNKGYARRSHVPGTCAEPVDQDKAELDVGKAQLVKDQCIGP